MSRIRLQVSLGQPRTTTTFCKVLRRPICDSPRKPKIILTNGSTRTVCAGQLKEDHLPRVASILHSLVWFNRYLFQIKCFNERHVDDPQMPGLIPAIKKVRPDIPIVYRSHIEIRSDLTSIKGSPQEEVWNYLWKNIQIADLFISHPVSKFVPKDVPMEKVALLGAATDL